MKTCTFKSRFSFMNPDEPNCGESGLINLHKDSNNANLRYSSLSNFRQIHENTELTNILNSFTKQSSLNNNNNQINDESPPIINILAESYRIKLTERLSNCNSQKAEQNKQFFNQIVPILYTTPHVPQNKRHVHFIPNKYDIIPKNATVFDFNAAMIEHNEKITERQELAIAYAEMLCSDISSSAPSSSRISPYFKYASQRSAAKIAFDRSGQQKNNRPTLPPNQSSKKRIKIYQVKDQYDRPNFSDCCRESFYYQQNSPYGQNSTLNDALSIFKLNVPNSKTTQLASQGNYQQQRKQNFKKSPSLSRPQCYRNSNGNKFNSGGYPDKESSSIRTKRYRGPLQVISPNSVECSFTSSTYENQNKSYNKFKEGFY